MPAAPIFSVLILLCLPLALSGNRVIAADTEQIVRTVCAQCHGLDGNSVVATYPKLAGHPAAYIAKQINDFIAGTRHHELMSKDLKKRGWSFVGPTTMYAFMQAMGLVNDHIEGCEREP